MSVHQLPDEAPEAAVDGRAPGAVVTTLVQASNYCGPAPAAPVSVAFVVPEGRTVATPASPTDTTLPPCNGAPDSPGSIEMHPWAR